MVTYKDRPWLKHYDPGVPHTLEPYPNFPVHQFLLDAAQKFPDRPALVTSLKLPIVGRQTAHITYAELNRYSDALAAALVNLGLKKGGRVALIMPNVTAFVISYYAVYKAGGVVAACNPTYPAEKMQFQINDCDAEIVICLSMFYNMVKEIQPRTQVKTVIVTNVKDYFPPLGNVLFTLTRERKGGHRVRLQAGDHWLLEILKVYDGRKSNVSVSAEDIAIFQYTGGTTGNSKGAMGQHKAVTANTLQMQAWTFATNDESLKKDFEHMTFLGAIPMFHAYGMIVMIGLSVAMNGTIVLVPNARDIDDVVDVIAHFKPNVFNGVPALFNAINNHPRVKSGEVSLKSIRISSSGAAPLPPATKRDFESRMSGRLTEGYGMSEAPTAATSNPLGGENRAGSVGMPLPDMDMRIVDLDTGDSEMPVGEVGEIIMHGPQLMLGYHKMPTETANTLRQHDGKTFLYTGDIGKMDEDGYFYIVDRKKDMALIGGFNVYPNNIEKVLKEHPAVLEVGVAAVPHPDARRQGEEALKAWIVLQPNANITEAELIAHCEKYLAGYEVPRRIAFIKELPKTVVGKTLRRELIRLELEEREKA
ncbi:MAG: AMP-binding protein [Chloroflexi bacterium]|nr:AMP-binding protein [Chloroflexota bacterium]